MLDDLDFDDIVEETSLSLKSSQTPSLLWNFPPVYRPVRQASAIAPISDSVSAVQHAVSDCSEEDQQSVDTFHAEISAGQLSESLVHWFCVAPGVAIARISLGNASDDTLASLCRQCASDASVHAILAVLTALLDRSRALTATASRSLAAAVASVATACPRPFADHFVAPLLCASTGAPQAEIVSRVAKSAPSCVAACLRGVCAAARSSGALSDPLSALLQRLLAERVSIESEAAADVASTLSALGPMAPGSAKVAAAVMAAASTHAAAVRMNSSCLESRC
jgi:hypothetical protein